MVGLVLVGWDIYARVVQEPQSASTEVISSPASTGVDSREVLASSAPISTPTGAKISPRPSAKPSVKPSPSPTPTPAPLADYYPSTFRIGGSETNGTTFEETASLANLTAEIVFRQDVMITSSASVKVRVYYDGTYKTEIVRTEYGAYGAAFSYLLPIDPGSHTVKFVINEDHSIKESNYSNNEKSVTYTINGDKTAPSFTIDGPYVIDGQTCMRWINLEDNVSVYTDVWAKWKMDDGSWSEKTSGTAYGCVGGVTGSLHTYSVHAEDRRGNVKEDSRQFTSL